MKKIFNTSFAIILLIGLLFTSCSNKQIELNQLASYDDVGIRLPDNWNYDIEEIEPDLAYQITCVSKDEENTVIIAWFELETDLNEYIISVVEEFKGQLYFEYANFNQATNVKFQNINAIKKTFTGRYLDFEYHGDFTVFYHDGATYLIQVLGNPDFYKSNLKSEILSSIQIISSVNYKTTEKKTINEVPSDWAEYRMKSICSFAVPPTLELRKDESVLAKLMDAYRDGMKKIYEIEIRESNLVFQPVGLNENIEGANSKYARILIKHQTGQPNDFFRSSEQFDNLREELDEMNEYIYNEFIQTISGTNMKLIEWFPVEFSSINGLAYQKQSYTRQMLDQPVVMVQEYIFHNYDELVKITLSYRLNESDIWKDDFERVLMSFDLSTRK